MDMAFVTQYIKNAYQKDDGNAVLATEGTSNNSNKTDCFSYKGEWTNVQQHITKKASLQLHSNNFYYCLKVSLLRDWSLKL